MNRTWVVAIAGVGAAGVAALVIAVLRCEAQGAAAVAPAASTTSAAPTDPAGLSAPATASLPIASSGVGAAVAAAADAPRVAHPPARTVAAGDAVTTTAKTAIELPAAAGALRIRELAARLPELTDVARLGRTFSGDPEMVRLLTPLLDEWAASTEPAERVRAEVLRAGMLGEQGAESWGAAIDRASDPSVRYALLSAPPVSGAAAADRPYVDRLISVAAADPDAKARAAALSGLPAELPADALDRLAGGAGRERDAAVRADLVRLLGRSRSDAAGVVRTLREIGFDAAEDRGIRREALAGLARAASAHPDLLTATEMETLEKTLGELDR